VERRLVDEWVTDIGFKACITYKATGNLGAVRILLGHAARKHREVSRRGR
jgi:hypothetical protein